MREGYVSYFRPFELRERRGGGESGEGWGLFSHVQRRVMRMRQMRLKMPAIFFVWTVACLLVVCLRSDREKITRQTFFVSIDRRDGFDDGC